MDRREAVFRNFEKYKEYTEDRVKSGIELYRKGFAEIKLVDSENNQVNKEYTVEIKQKTHEFKYGANIFMLDEFETQEKNKLYREKFAETFNIATLPFYWNDLEPQEGMLRFKKDSPKIYRRPAIDLCIEYCREKGIEPKAHCLNYDLYRPKWTKNLSAAEYKAKLVKRFKELSEEYADKIPSWEVTNESLAGGLDEWLDKSEFFRSDDFVEWSFDLAGKYFPNNRLIINDWNIWLDAYKGNRSLYYMQIERLINSKKGHLDSIGMQFHCFYDRDYEKEVAKIKYNPLHLYGLLDKYAQFGRKIQITEMTLGALSNDPEDEEIQADLLEALYSVFFSHPAMEGIIYWNLVDGYAADAPKGDMTAGENKWYGGLLRFDMSEKPAFQRIKKLFNEIWHTEESKMTENGIAMFKAFYGDYDIIIKKENTTVKKQISISSQKDNKFIIQI
ncbi:MAG: endo-1,4-beta-xylanase [Firmicutes bacterium]|nr:endo-1,4-beta-xylanase [Bacillota bacterium]